MPSIVKEQATIKLFPGTYYEGGQIRKKMVIGNDWINVVGDSTTPTLVVFTGKNPESPNDPLLKSGPIFIDQTNVLFTGISFQDYEINAIELSNPYRVIFDDCIFTRARVAQTDGVSRFRRCQFVEAPGVLRMLYVLNKGHMILDDCVISNTQKGVGLYFNSILTLVRTEFRNTSVEAINARGGSIVNFNSSTSPNRIINSPLGILGRGNVVLTGTSGGLSFSGVSTQYSLHSGSVIAD